MSTKIAITGKSGSGKTTLTKTFLSIIKEKFPEKSILLFDNDLAGELGHSFGLDIRNTIYGIRCGKHEYKTGIPENMAKNEFIDWAMEDIIVSVDENVDLIVSWLPGVKDCRCPITEQISNAVKRVLKRYDFIIFDCEFDLKYLMQLVDIDIDLSVIVATPTVESIKLASRISEYSAKYAAGGQMGIIINKVYDQDLSVVSGLAKSADLDVLGIIPYDEFLAKGSIERKSDKLVEAVKDFYGRLNLPQGDY